MFFTCLRSTSRLCAVAPRLTRSVVNRATSWAVPEPKGSIATPADFLKEIGRASETKLDVELWDELWKLSGHELKEKGLSVRDRRYILWCMEKYRAGLPIESFAHEPRPKKTVRGWGPAVQDGKRIRSRRVKNKDVPSSSEKRKERKEREERIQLRRIKDEFRRQEYTTMSP